AGLVRATRPGGQVAIEDVDFTGHFCHPECRAFRRYVELYQAVVRRKQADANIGTRLPGLLRLAGLEAIRVEVVQPTFLEGPGKHLATVTLLRIADAL